MLGTVITGSSVTDFWGPSGRPLSTNDFWGPHDVMRKQALEYASWGWPIFPVKPSKDPFVSQYSDSLDPDQINAWYTMWPEALIGRRALADEFIIDIDPRHGGDKTWEALLDTFGDIPPQRSHESGRRDGGRHLWFRLPDGIPLPVSHNLDEWAKAHVVGEQLINKVTFMPTRWVSGLDIIRKDHRYTILPPSPHPATGKPYRWLSEPRAALGEAPEWLLKLLVPPVRLERASQASVESPADHYCATHTWNEILAPLGWTVVIGDGESDESHWRHPEATNDTSASIRHGCLFVHSTSTAFEPTAPGDPHGYTKFRAFAVLYHNSDQSAAARTIIPPRSTFPMAVAVAEPVVVAPKTFRPMPLTELFAMPNKFEWLVEGLWAAGSYGQLAGREKTLKSHLAMMIGIGVAAKVPVLGEFDVPRQLPVLYYVGEGGILPWRRRFQRLSESLGVDAVTLPIHPVFDIGPVMSPEFQDGLMANLEEFEPGLVILDPLYSYHGSSTSAANLHEEGALLNAISGPCSHAGAALIIVNHFAKSATETRLSSITMSGGAEHSDSWILMQHSKDPDVDEGRFFLRADIGSRQWGGQTRYIDLNVGRFDPKTGEHVGQVMFTTRTATKSGNDPTEPLAVTFDTIDIEQRRAADAERRMSQELTKQAFQGAWNPSTYGEEAF